jgi:hypothetical protein
MEIRVQVGNKPLPFFAEYPYFLWGEVNYDSEGDCARPTDRFWTELDVTNRHDDTTVSILREGSDTAPPVYSVSGSDLLTVQRAAYLTALRTEGGILTGEASSPEAPDRHFADVPYLTDFRAEADEVQAMFLNPALIPFDTQAWWGGWKWCRETASEFTSGLRHTMLAVQRGTADDKFMKWLKDYWNQPVPEWHREGVRHALTVLTGGDPAAPKSDSGRKSFFNWFRR